MLIRLLFLSACLVATPASAAELAVGKFSAEDLTGWTDQPFKGKTSYTFVRDNGTWVLQAHSVHAASGLLKKMELDPKKYPMLRWSWKIEHTLNKEDIKAKKGDDFAARVYVVFPRTFFWQMRAIIYAWSAKMPKDSVATSPYAANARVVAVESGDEKSGSWVKEERNIYEDYKKIFGDEPPALGGVALMTDTDDTRDEVTAWYGDIFLQGDR